MKFVAVWLLLRFVSLEPVITGGQGSIIDNDWMALGTTPVYQTEKACYAAAKRAPFVRDAGKGKTMMFFCVRGYRVDRPDDGTINTGTAGPIK